MKNRLSFLLVAGLISAPAFAADAPKLDWNLYGFFVAELNNVKVTNSTNPDNDVANRNRFSCSTSHLGFRGSYQAMPEIKVIWQFESSIGIDGDEPNKWGGRNSALGLQGNWGTVMAGNWDTPYADIAMKMGPFPGAMSFDASIINTAGFRTIGFTSATKVAADGTGNACFKRRQGNSVQYWSPEFQGFQAKLFYSMNEGRDSSPNPQKDPTMFSGTLTYTNPGLGLKVLYGYQVHNDYFGLNAMRFGYTPTVTGLAPDPTLARGGTGSKDEGHTLAAYWVAPTKTRVCAIVEQLKYRTDGTDPSVSWSDYKRTAWFVTLDHSFQAHKFFGGFGMANKGTLKDAAGLEADANNEFGAKQYYLGYAYTLAKGTWIYANYFALKNDANASYAPMPPVTATVGNTPTVCAGGESKGFGLGLIYKF